MDIETLNRALDRVPPYMAESVRRYLFEGVPPSRFLRYVLENNLHRAASAADDANQAALFGGGCVLDALPLNSWGSHKTVEAYLALGRKQTPVE